MYIDPLDRLKIKLLFNILLNPLIILELSYVRDILDEVQTLIGLSNNNKPLLGMMVQHYKAEKIDENKI